MKGNNTSVNSMHTLDSMPQTGCCSKKLASAASHNHRLILKPPIFKSKLLRIHWNNPLGLLPLAPTGWLWTKLTQPLSWEGPEKFFKFQGNHQSTKEKGIPSTLSCTHTKYCSRQFQVPNRFSINVVMLWLRLTLQNWELIFFALHERQGKFFESVGSGQWL